MFWSRVFSVCPSFASGYLKKTVVLAPCAVCEETGEDYEHKAWDIAITPLLPLLYLTMGPAWICCLAWPQIALFL